MSSPLQQPGAMVGATAAEPKLFRAVDSQLANNIERLAGIIQRLYEIKCGFVGGAEPTLSSDKDKVELTTSLADQLGSKSNTISSQVIMMEKYITDLENAW